MVFRYDVSQRLSCKMSCPGAPDFFTNTTCQKYIAGAEYPSDHDFLLWFNISSLQIKSI